MKRRSHGQTDADRIGAGEPTLREQFLGEPNRNHFKTPTLVVIDLKGKHVFSFIFTEPHLLGKKQTVYWRVQDKHAIMPKKMLVVDNVNDGKKYKVFFTSEFVLQKWRTTTGLVEAYATAC